jgi:Protein of unknown function (DUF499)
VTERSIFGDLKPWFGIATPHEDIRKGQLSEAIFAANLWAVVQGDAPDVYLYPEAFFPKTYLTTGLTNVLRKVSRALSGNADSGDRIMSLQTAFGGGKTHTLVALWHLAKYTDVIRESSTCADVRKALGEELPNQVKGVAVFTNQTCDATQGRQTPEGIHTRTLWGELALQLGGVELYRKIEANDQARTVPQGLFTEILRQAAPCLILLDELADYCVGAAAVEVGAATLADQTISFAQQLTEAVQQVKGVALVATLPASHLEVSSSEKGQEILNRLERRFGRMSADIKPVADEEIYEVVRRRLFETLGDPADHARVADAYLKMYQQHKNEVPTEATRGTYKERITAAFPFHPTLIDAFYLRWGSHGDFQRTRGVLRLLASIVGDLWQRRNTETQSQPLIQPCHIRWTVDAIHAALTRLWGAAYDSVVAADVIGERANATALDEERSGDYLTEKITQGLAASILLGSFGGQGERAGYSTKDLKLCISRPALNWSYTDGALLTFDDERAFYLHNAGAGSLGKRYWFGTTPTLNKLVVQYRGQFAAQNFDAEINETIQKQAENIKSDLTTWRILVNPQADLPEQKSLALLIMPADTAYSENGGQRLIASPIEQRIMELSQKCGSKDRLYRNTLLFLLPSSRGLTKLRSALREVTALEAVKRDYGTKLDAEQAKELEKRLDTARKSVTDSLGSAYSYVARIEGQQSVTVALSDAKPAFADHLKLVWDQVIDEEWVLRKVGAVTLQKAGLIPTAEGIRVKDALEAFLRYTDKPMLASREALMQGLKEACKDRLIGIGRGINFNNLQKRWCGEDVMLDPNEDGLWIIPPFEPEQPQATTPSSTSTASSTQAHTPSSAGTEPSSQQRATSSGVQGETSGAASGTHKQITKIKITGNVPAENWTDIFRSFVGPASRMNLGQLRLGINFELVTKASNALDENDSTLKAMKEAARQLGLQMDEE